MNVYVASSFKNKRYPQVVEALRAAGHIVYDWRDNEHRGGRGLSEKDRAATTLEAFHAALEKPGAIETHRSHEAALDQCDACVLVLPCGRSAHSEFGYARQPQGRRRLVILFDLATEPLQHDLMYRWADHLCETIEDVVQVLAEPLPRGGGDGEFSEQDLQALQKAARDSHVASNVPQFLRSFCACGYVSGPGTAACAAYRRLLRAVSGEVSRG